MFTFNDFPAGSPSNPIAKAQEHTILIIDSNGARSQKIARLLTLASLHAFVFPTAYQAFESFLQERLEPRVILLGQRDEMSSNTFARFTRHLKQEFQRTPPTLPITDLPPIDGNLLIADNAFSKTTHRVVPSTTAFLQAIWKVLPSARFSLSVAKPSVVLDSLPKVDLQPRVSQHPRVSNNNFLNVLKASKKVIPADQWDTLMTNVGLAQFLRLDAWPSDSEQCLIPLEYLTCLSRATMFSDPQNAIQKVQTVNSMASSEIVKKPKLMFIIQQVLKLAGRDRVMRMALTDMVSKLDESCGGDKIHAWATLDNGSIVLVFYSSLGSYGLMGATSPSCFSLHAMLIFMLNTLKQEKNWSVREIECSSQTNTGHCAFLLTPRSS